MKRLPNGCTYPRGNARDTATYSVIGKAEIAPFVAAHLFQASNAMGLAIRPMMVLAIKILKTLITTALREVERLQTPYRVKGRR
jgi:hypothetical protein